MIRPDHGPLRSLLTSTSSKNDDGDDFYGAATPTPLTPEATCGTAGDGYCDSGKYAQRDADWVVPVLLYIARSETRAD